MRDYGRIRTSFWTDEKILGLSDRGKLLAAYLLSSPHSNGVGCYRLPLSYIEGDLGWPAETVRQTVSELLSIGFIERCENTSWTLVVNFLRHNPIENPNVGKSLSKIADAVPRSLGFFPTLLKGLEQYGERFPNGFLDGLRNSIVRVTGTESLAKPEPKPSLPLANGSEPGAARKPNVGNGSAPKSPITKDATELVDAFWAIRESFWGGDPNGRMPSHGDGAIAQRWVEAGVPFYPARWFFEDRMRRMHEGSKSPPNGLRYFEKAILEAQEHGWPGYREGM